MASEQLQVNFRMPAELKARLEDVAKVAGRTLTAEIVVRLQQSFEPREDANARELLQLSNHLLARLVLDLYDALPLQMQRSEGVALRAKLANSILAKDADGMAEALGALLRTPPEEIAKVQRELRELGAVSPPVKKAPRRP